MKIPREILSSMSADCRLNGSASHSTTRRNTIGVPAAVNLAGISLASSSLADRRAAASRYLLRTVNLFITDESGRGLTAYGIVIAVVLLACGILYGLFATKPIFNRFMGCQACGMG